MNSDESAKPMFETIPVGETQATPPVKKSSTSKKIIILFTAVVILIAVIVFSIMLISPKTPPPPSASPTTIPSAKPLTLTVTNPADGELAVANEILVSGTTLPETTVAVFTETDEVTIESDQSGAFETTISLEDGINNLVVTAFSDSGEEKTVSLDVVYDSET